jgi:predicted ester cyclase
MRLNILGMNDLGSRVRRLIAEVWNGERDESAYELVAPECPGLGSNGPKGVLAFHRDRRAAFPDQRYEIVDMLVDGDRVAVRWRGTGTQRGWFGPVPPTGNKVDYEGVTWLRFDANGHVADIWSVNEQYEVLDQLGVDFRPPAALADDIRAGWEA